MPYPNEHSCRLRPPGDFQKDSFRSTTRKHNGKEYRVIVGRPKGKKTAAEQAYRYDKDEWTESAARSHCEDHDGTFEPASKEDGATMRGFTVRLEELNDLYIVLKARGVKKDLANIPGLRLLDDELETGVKALVDDDEDAIVAFLFSKGRFTEDQAKDWVKQAEKDGVNLSFAVGYPRAGLDVDGIIRAALDLFRVIPLRQMETALDDDLSFDTIRLLLAKALNGQDGEGVKIDGRYRWAWLVEVFADYCIVELEAELYKVPYDIDENGEVTLGDFTRVLRQYVPFSVDSAAAVALDLSRGFGVELKVGLRDPPATFAAQVEGDNLIWKEIFQVSTTFRPITGEPLIIDQRMIDALHESFEATVLGIVPITARDHYVEFDGLVPAEDTKGTVERLVKEGGSLFAGLNVVDDDIRAGVLEKQTIRDCSIYAWADFHDRRTGQVWDWVLVHVLLTNYPQLPDLQPFGVKPASLSAAGFEGADFKPYMEIFMPENTTSTTPGTQGLSDEDRQALEQLRALQAEGFSVQTLAEQRAALRTQARDLEVRQIVAALESNAERPDVVQVEGRRHYPAVIAAVETALRGEDNEFVAASITQTGQSPLDAVVLTIVNALPAEARLPMNNAPTRPDRSMDAAGDTPASQPQHRTEPLPPGTEITDEAIVRLDAQIGGAPAE